MKTLKDYKDEDLEYVFEQLISSAQHDSTGEMRDVCRRIHSNPLFKHQSDLMFVGLFAKQGGLITNHNFGCAMHVGMELGYMLAHREMDNALLEKEMLVPIK